MIGHNPTGVTLILFAKAPLAGEVKTRLSPLLGPEGAALLAGAFIDDALRLIRSLEWARPVLATTGAFDSTWDERLRDILRWPQGPGDLGLRMERVLARALQEAEAAILIGSDIPTLTRAHLDEARAALERHDAVLGPAEDGGFYLIGLRRCPNGLLAGLPWSTDGTLEVTWERLSSRGLEPAAISTCSDVDRPEDLLRLVAELKRGGVEAPACEVVLRRLAPSLFEK